MNTKNCQTDHFMGAATYNAAIAELRWMAAYSPHLDFSLALQQAQQDENATRRPDEQGAGA